MRTTLQILIFLILTSCNPKIIIPNNFKIVKATDSTSFIEWTDGNIFYKSSKPIDNNYVDNKTYTKWINKKYICLRHSNGSDSWTDIVLPFSNNNYKIFENALEYDKKNGIVIYETDSANFKLIAENIDNEKKEFIGEDWKNCKSVFPHYCIDSINLNDEKMYIEWTTPNNIDKSNRKEIKIIKLKI